MRRRNGARYYGRFRIKVDEKKYREGLAKAEWNALFDEEEFERMCERAGLSVEDGKKALASLKGE